MTEYAYVGQELDLFGGAKNWKRYIQSLIAPYLHGRVLEVGAGVGGTTRFLVNEYVHEWVCLDPDTTLVNRISDAVSAGELPPVCAPICGTIETVEKIGFDAIVYIDVLEHIEDDRAELDAAARLLLPGGCLMVLSPAHPLLFSEFDRGVGHYRRYTRAMLGDVAPLGVQLERLDYVDSVGFLASLANRLLMRRTLPTRGQVKIWDTLMVPISKRIDPLLGFAFGKSILGVWTKT